MSPGWILIDRCGKHFGTILNYLRDGAVPLPESRREIEELLAEAKYYLVQGLVDECQAALQVGTGLRGSWGWAGFSPGLHVVILEAGMEMGIVRVSSAGVWSHLGEPASLQSCWSPVVIFVML